MFGIFQNIGLPELVIILVIILLLFGATKLPKLARGLGSSVKEFKKGMEEGAENTDAKDEAKKPEEKK